MGSGQCLLLEKLKKLWCIFFAQWAGHQPYIYTSLQGLFKMTFTRYHFIFRIISSPSECPSTSYWRLNGQYRRFCIFDQPNFSLNLWYLIVFERKQLSLSISNIFRPSEQKNSLYWLRTVHFCMIMTYCREIFAQWTGTSTLREKPGGYQPFWTSLVIETDFRLV